MQVLSGRTGQQDGLRGGEGPVGEMVQGFYLFPECNYPQDIRPGKCGETELLPAAAFCGVPDLCDYRPEHGAVSRRECPPFRVRGAPDLFQRLLNCLVPLQQVAASSQVVFG